MRRLWLAAIIGIAMTATQANAHHSTANYDYTKTVVLKGTLKQLQWTNPHSFLQVLVPDGKGGTVEWSVESGSPALARRLGWGPEMFKPGDKLTVVIAPIRSGGPGGTLRTVTLPNGQVLSGPGNQSKFDLGLPTLKPATQGH